MVIMFVAFAVPMATNMITMRGIVAIGTAKASHVASLGDVVGMSELLYVLLLLYLLVMGAGSLSVDGFIRRRRLGSLSVVGSNRGGWVFARSTT